MYTLKKLRTFGTVGELYDIYALDAEIDEVVNNDEVFNELGWSYEYDKDDPYDEGYYYRMDSPDEHYTWEEFSLEVIYDWLHNQRVKWGMMKI
jgi:hypothetical protein